MEAYKGLLSERTKMVAITHMSNVLGTINDAAEIVRLAHAAGAPVLLDGCQAIVHAKVDVKALDVDFYVFSGHKLYGPTGIGVLYGKAERLAALPPYQGGGEMIGSVSMDKITYADPPHRFEAGTPAILEAVGLGAAIEWLNGLDRDAASSPTNTPSMSGSRPAATASTACGSWATAPGKGAVLSFTVEGAHAHDIAQVLDRYGVAVRAGTHCAEPLMRVLASRRARAPPSPYITPWPRPTRS
jgi:cysteine desulfurase/selenocysteine lyase